MALRGSHGPRPLGVPGPGRLSGGATEVLFVYGTLRAGRAPAPLAAWLDGLPRRFATAPGRLLDLGDYPGALAADGPARAGAAEPRIVGELVVVPHERMAELDRYEGFDGADPARSLFLRERTVATTADGTRVPCWIYRYNL